jgi:hypothetical protein
MSCRLVSVMLLALYVLVTPRASAAPFVNLDIEQATIPPGTLPGFVNASAAFPGWTARIGAVPASSVLYNEDGIGGPAVVL